MTKQEFFDLCKTHNWHFDLMDYAKDEYTKHYKQHELLRAHAYAHDNLYKIFKAYQDFAWDLWLNGNNAKLAAPNLKEF